MKTSGIASFGNAYGTECFLGLFSPAGLDLKKSLDWIMGAYRERLENAGLDAGSEVFMRLHASDITNQGEWLLGKLGDLRARSFLSLVGQPPANGGKLALEAYHVAPTSGGIQKNKVSPEVLRVGHGAYTSLFMRSRPRSPGFSFDQTTQIFEHQGNMLASLGGSLADNVLRTWLYVRDVDNNYQGMVDCRRDLFARAGLTKDTHFIASTGIEGQGESPSDLVTMDSLSIFGLRPGQISYMTALDHLCHTHLYNVTFERGTRVTYGDRSHYYISGTASIDHKGVTLFPYDVVKQTKRTLENISALLEGYEATLSDMRLAVVYLRDLADADVVRSMLAEALPEECAWIMVQGSVCRPQWLVEIEGIAVSAHADESFTPFL